MSVPDRDVTISINAKDNTAAATRAAVRNFQELQKQQRENEAETDRLSQRLGAWEKQLARAATAVVGLAGNIASFTSLIGPATTTLVAAGRAAATFGKDVAATGAALAPLAAYIPAIVGEVGLLETTLKLVGPAFGKALSPISSQFRDAKGNAAGLTLQLQALATKGVGQLAKQFVKVNLPTIGKGMESISKSTNQVVVAVGRWINSVPGQQAIAQIVDATAESAAALAPHVADAATAIGHLAGQTPGLANLGGVIGGLLDKFTKWANAITMADVSAAFATVARIEGKLGDAYNQLKAGISWLAANRDKIKAFSSDLAAVGVAFSIATGNIPGIIAGAFSLIFNNFNRVKSALKSIDLKPWQIAFDNLATASKNLLTSAGQVALVLAPLAGDAVAPLSAAVKDLSDGIKDVTNFVSNHATTFQALAVSLAAVYTWTKLLALQEWALTAAQLALDAAMDANVIGIIVVAVIALAAAFAYLWTHSSAFRKFWIGLWDDIKGAALAVANWFAGPFAGGFVSAWNGIKSAAVAVAGWFSGPFAGAFVAAFHAVAAPALWLWHNVLDPMWQGIVAAAQVATQIIVSAWNLWVYTMKVTVGAAAMWLWHAAIEPAFNGIVAAAQAVGAAATWLWKTAIQPAFNAIASLATWLWKNAILPPANGIKSAITAIGNAALWLWHTAIQPAMNGAGSAISTVWTKLIRPTFNAISGAARTVGSGIAAAFSGIAGAISRGVSGAAGIVKSALNGIISAIDGAIGKVNGFISGVNKVPGVNFPKLPTIPHLAAGGIVPARPGGTLIVAGEGGRDEAVVPLPPGGDGGAGLLGGVMHVEIPIQIGDEVVRVVRTEIDLSNRQARRRVLAGVRG